MLSDDYIEVQVNDHFLSAIVNGDYSGMSDEDEAKLNTFLDDYSLERGCFSSAITDRGEGLCDVNELWSDRLAVLRFYLYEGDD